MKKIIFYTLMVLLSLSFGCGKFLDVNHDPNNPGESTVQLVFPSAVTYTASVLGSNTLMLGQIWSQQWTAINFYHGEETYSVPAGQYDYDIGTWSRLYTSALMDYQWVKTTAAADSNWTYFFMAEMMQCYTFQVLADLFEDIPITGALENDLVGFDYGSDVYDILLERIDNALMLDLEAASCEQPGTDDLIFSGNMDKWVAFAYTLKLKIYLRQTEARPEIAKAGIDDIFNNNRPLLNEDVVYDVFSNESGKDNFMYAKEFRGGNISMRASKTFIDYLIEKEDPRVDFIFKPAAVGHAGMYQGDYLNVYSGFNAENPQLSKPRITPLMPFYFFTKAQILFMQAEVAARYGHGDAQTLYNEAISADVVRLNTTFKDEIELGELTAFTADTTILVDAPFPTSGDLEDELEAIIVQKWIASAGVTSLEAFFDHNRTGYPRESSVFLKDEDFSSTYVIGEWLSAPSSVLAPPNIFPKRLLYSSSEINRNPNAPQEFKLINEPLWWDGAPYSYQ